MCNRGIRGDDEIATRDDRRRVKKRPFAFVEILIKFFDHHSVWQVLELAFTCTLVQRNEPHAIDFGEIAEQCNREGSTLIDLMRTPLPADANLEPLFSKF